MCDSAAAERLADALLDATGRRFGTRRRRVRIARDCLTEVLADSDAARELLERLGAGSLHHALAQIRDHQTPCQQCGEPHCLQVSGTGDGAYVYSWRDPFDGHVYDPTPAAEVAAAALRDGVAPKDGDAWEVGA